MMQRLRDQPASAEPVATEMARLLASTQPANPSALAERRILARLDEPQRARTRLLIPVALLVIAMTAGAGAWVMHATPSTPPPTPAPVIDPPAAPKISAPPIQHLPVHAPPIIPPPNVIAPVIEKHDSGALQSPHRDVVRVETPPEPAPVESVITPAAERAALVARARVALHDDPQTAYDLASRYVADNPDGPLVEEAYAIGIEANTALGKPTAAADVAADYLAKFPSGRFAKLATETERFAQRAPSH